MNKGLVAYSILPIVVFAIAFNVFFKTESIDLKNYDVAGLELDYTVAIEADSEQAAEDKINLELSYCVSPILGKSFVGFKEALAFKESRGNYRTVNTLGYLGKYQFGRETLKLIGIYNTTSFLQNPELQEKAFIANAMRNKWILRRDIKRFVGKQIDGIVVTESGILAAAHLAGPGSVKKYLRSYGALGFTDAYGTTVRNYMKRFSGYDTSFIQANKKAKASLL